MLIEVTCKQCGRKVMVRLKDVGDAVRLKCSECDNGTKRVHG